MLDPCGGDVGDRLGHRHAAGGGSVGQRQQRTLTQGHRLAADGLEANGRHRAVGHWHLPWPDHLIAHGQPADGAITDGDEKALGGDGRQP